MVVADRTGIPHGRIEVVHGDTDVVPSASSPAGPGRLQVAGASVASAAAKLVDAARAAGRRSAGGEPPTTWCSTGRPGASTWPARPAVAVGWARRSAADAVEAPSRCTGSTTSPPSQPTFPFGAHVGRGRGRHRDRAGPAAAASWPATTPARILNPLLADGQVHGGLAQGVAQALLEEVRFDEDGNPLTTNFADYAVISAAELPIFERIAAARPRPSSTSSAPRASASRAPSGPPRRCRTRWSMPWPTSASATSTCPARPSGSGGPSAPPAEKTFLGKQAEPPRLGQDDLGHIAVSGHHGRGQRENHPDRQRPAREGEVEPRTLLVHYLPRRPRPHGHQRRLRHVVVRGVHRPPRRRVGEVVHGARRPGRRPRRSRPSRAWPTATDAAPDAGRPSTSTTASSAGTAPRAW